MNGIQLRMLEIAEWARMETPRKIVSAVVAPSPTRKPARQDRVTVWEAMIAFTGPGGAARERPIPVPARIVTRTSRTTTRPTHPCTSNAAARLIAARTFDPARAHRRFDV